MKSDIPRVAGLPAPAIIEAGSATSSIALLVLLCGTFMVVLDFFIVNVALPSIQQDLRADSGALQFVVVGYALANAAMLITGGRLGDLYGRKRLFLSGMGMFTAASLACGLAPTVGILNTARVAQGIAGALLQPQVLAMLGLLYTGRQRAKAFSAYGLTLGLGAASGQLVGGLLIHADVAGLAWRSCFLINLPIGLLALLLGMRVLPACDSAGAGASAKSLDWPGAALVAALLASALLPLVLGREQGWPWWSLACLSTLPMLWLVFWRRQHSSDLRGGHPLIAPSVMRHKPFSIGLAVTMLFYSGNASFYFILALYLQDGLALSPLQSGLVFTVLALGFFAASINAPALNRLLGRRAILIGALVLGVGHAALFAAAGWMKTGSLALLVPILLVQGCGLGMVMAPLVSTVLAGTPAMHTGVASGILASVQQLGNALGVALIGIVFYGVAGSATLVEPAAVSRGFAAGTIYLALAAFATALMYRRHAAMAGAEAQT